MECFAVPPQATLRPVATPSKNHGPSSWFQIVKMRLASLAESPVMRRLPAGVAAKLSVRGHQVALRLEVATPMWPPAVRTGASAVMVEDSARGAMCDA